MQRVRLALFLGVLLLADIHAASAQMGFFGASDAPEETVTMFPWRREKFLEPTLGLSLIERQLRFLSGISTDGLTRSFVFSLEGRIRTGIFGLYRPDVDQLYDVLRVVRFIRYRPPPDVKLHLRLGPLTRVKVGTGHLVNFYQSTTAWDARRVGLEAALFLPFLQIAAFTDDVRFERLTGVSFQIRPLFALLSAHPLLRQLELGIHIAADKLFTQKAAERLVGYHVELRTNLLQPGSDFFFSPYLSFARYLQYGSGIGIGLLTGSPNLGDAVRFHAQLTLYYNSRDFIPGYFNSFYMVQNRLERIVDANTYFDTGELRPVGTLLHESRGGADLLHEIRILFFDQFELWHQFKRHYGSQPLSEYHLRIFLYPRRQNRLRFFFIFHRAGLTSFFSIFSKLRNQNTQALGISYRYRGNLWLTMETRYTYRETGRDTEEGKTYFVVQRRFEPRVSLRMRF